MNNLERIVGVTFGRTLFVSFSYNVVFLFALFELHRYNIMEICCGTE
jgi:hypothetical protein